MQSDYILINRNELADLVTKAVRDALQQKRLVYGIKEAEEKPFKIL